MSHVNSGEEARRAEAAPFAAATESSLVSRPRKTARDWLLWATPAAIVGAGLAAAGALFARRQGVESIFWWFCGVGGVWLVMTVVAAMMLAEVVMAHHHDHKMTALEFVIFGTISVLSLAVVLGALCWWLALRPSVSVAIMLWGQLVPLFPTFQACARYQLFNLALKRFDARNQHHELATPSRRSSRSTHSPPPQLPSLRNSHQSERGWRPSGWDWPSLRERSSDPAERELAERGGRHSRRASLASGRSPRHQDTDSSVDSAEDVFPYDQHPPHPRAPSTPSAPHSVHSSHRRVPSNESLPDHDIFDLPRRSTASNITRAQPFDATAPHQIHHAARPSHSAPLHAADLPSSWHHDSSAPF